MITKDRRDGRVFKTDVIPAPKKKGLPEDFQRKNPLPRHKDGTHSDRVKWSDAAKYPAGSIAYVDQNGEIAQIHAGGLVYSTNVPGGIAVNSFPNVSVGKMSAGANSAVANAATAVKNFGQIMASGIVSGVQQGYSYPFPVRSGAVSYEGSSQHIEITVNETGDGELAQALNILPGLAKLLTLRLIGDEKTGFVVSEVLIELNVAPQVGKMIDAHNVHTMNVDDAANQILVQPRLGLRGRPIPRTR